MSRTILVALLVFLAACGDEGIQEPVGNGISISGGDDNAPTRTAGDSFALVPGPVFSTVEIPFVYENRTKGTTYYLIHCNGAFDFRLEKRVGDGWVEAHAPMIPACLSLLPIRIAPGERWSASARVYVSIQDGVPPEPIALEPEGTYRIVLSTLSAFDPAGYPFGPGIPKESRVSNAFQLLAAEPSPERGLMAIGGTAQ